ncbi:hypothetical protein [Photobacterium damselae]|uniref:hypothetical protein n=1 Tax=Photobacterium damselae TaxID=38293 RepID=UPI000DFE43EA|nr:hypothetical protein [Photobacterium damselae]SUB90740.1 Uncharacterised protein [Photobacterium damselae]
MRVIKIIIYLFMICISISSFATLKPINHGTKNNKFLFIENNQDNDMFLSPAGAAVDPRFTGANRWVKHKKGAGGQISLGYADMTLNLAITGYKFVDMWNENSPIRNPYESQRCRIIDPDCNNDTSTPNDRPHRTDAKGFYGLDPSYGWTHAKLTDSAYQYLRNMGVGDTLSFEMNVCFTTKDYDPLKERCIDQKSGSWYKGTVNQTKVAHLKITRTNAISEIMVDSNGNPTIIPGSKGCEVATVGSRSGVTCEFLAYDFNVSDSTYLNNTQVDTGVVSRISGIDNYDIQKSTDKSKWYPKTIYVGMKKLIGHDRFYLFLSNRFFKKAIKLGLDNIDLRDLIYFNFKNVTAVESGYYEISGTTIINVKPREFSVAIIPSDFSDNPTQEGIVGREKLKFSYDLVKSAPIPSSKFEIKLSQDIPGTDTNGYCLFRPPGDMDLNHAVPVPAYISFNKSAGGKFYELVNCDNGNVDLTKNDIAESRAPIITPSPDPAQPDTTTNFYKLDLLFDLTDPSLKENLGGSEWEGKIQQSGKLELKAVWN